MTAEENGARLAEEIRLLVDLIVDHAAPWLDSLAEAGHGARPGAGDAESDPHAGPGAGHESADAGQRAADGCQWCPLCALLAVCRGERVDVAARMVDQLTQLLALLRAVLADRWHPHEGVHMPGYEPGPRPADEESARVHRVRVRPRGTWDGPPAAESDERSWWVDADGRD